jgi:hypothetical protein
MRTATEAAAHLITTLGNAAHQRASDHYMNYENQNHPGAKYWRKVMEIIRNTGRISKGQQPLDLN